MRFSPTASASAGAVVGFLMLQSRGRPLCPIFWGLTCTYSVAAYNNRASQIQKQRQFRLYSSSSPSPEKTIIDFSGGKLAFSFHASISEIPSEVWDSCLPSGVCTNSESYSANKGEPAAFQHRRSPFLEHAWLRCLEESGCASVETGWTPKHLTVRIHSTSKPNAQDHPPQVVHGHKNTKTEANDLVDHDKGTSAISIDGCVPVYSKAHSKGEFIFDDLWADAAHQNGLDYYPKILVGVPFTPVTGSRFLWHSRIWNTFTLEEMAELNRAVGAFLKRAACEGCTNLNVNQGEVKDMIEWSSVHINFCTDQEATALTGPLGNDVVDITRMKRDEPNDNSDRCSTDDDDDDDDDDYDDSDKVDDDNIRVNNYGNPISQRLQAILRQLNDDETNHSYLRRTSLQYHWTNRNPLRAGERYCDFDDYLTCFRSKRRISIRRERERALKSGNIRIDAITGHDIIKVDGLVERMFEIYLSTVDKLFWGRQYLTLDFFQRLCKTSFVNNLCFLCARYNRKKEDDWSYNIETFNVNGKSNNKHDVSTWRAEDVFAGTFNVVKDGAFYGRYWGCLPGHQVKNLHFETCYWSAIEYCIANRLDRMEPGAGGGDYKMARGFDPQIIHSVHLICNPWLRRAVSLYLESETEYNIAVREHLLKKSSVAVRTSGVEE